MGLSHWRQISDHLTQGKAGGVAGKHSLRWAEPIQLGKQLPLQFQSLWNCLNNKVRIHYRRFQLTVQGNVVQGVLNGSGLNIAFLSHKDEFTGI